MTSLKFFSSFPKCYSVSVRSRINKLSMNVINIEGSFNQKHIDNAVSSLLDGFVISLPTDTIYGLACLAQNDKAIKSIYKIKKRRTDKPLAICVSEVEDIYTWGKVTVPEDLLTSLLPGPVTLIFERTETLNPCLNPDNNLVGIRIPDHAFIRNVVSKCGSPIALTSANISSEKSPLEISEFNELWDKLHKVFDGGSLGGSAHCRKGSTIVDLSVSGSYKVVRKVKMLKFQTKREKREAVIRASLLEHLKDSVQSLIYGPGGENVPRLSSSCPKGQVLGHTENTNALCCVLEAIFIHGLKDTLGERLSSMFSGDLDRMPVPNFWLVVMVISHRDLIQQVSSLSYIMSDVGKGRAWMRLSLNQGQLISYLSVLASDSQTLKDYYRPTAFLKDTESCDIMLRILHPLTGITFNLATNAAVLNTWSQTPLILSGTWIPAKYEQSTAPILSATDVASTFTDSDSEDTCIAIPNTPLSDQMFDFIIGGTPETKFINDSGEGNEKSLLEELQESFIYKDEEYSQSDASGLKTPIVGSVPKSVDDKPQEISDDINVASENLNILEEDLDENLRHRRPSSTTTQSERESVMNRSISVQSDTNEYRNLLADWETSDIVENLPAFLTANSSPFHLAENLIHVVPKEATIPEEDRDFEFLSANLPSEKEMSAFLPFLTILMNEKGLDYQNYHCNTSSCSVPIGMIHGKPRVCKYDGRYYCYDCHQGDTSIIPAKVIHNWDFQPYPVCVANKKWLDTVLMHPLLDIRLVNSKLYRHIPELSELQMLRVQLHFIQAYLFTCNIDKGQELRKIFWPREHMYEHVHLYSVLDLKQVYDGKLVPLARQAVTEGKAHIMKCQVCYVRGFICEVCKDRQIIFPFQLTDTFTCGTCCGVYHKICVVRQIDCPRCQRLDKRQRDAGAISREDCDI